MSRSETQSQNPLRAYVERMTRLLRAAPDESTVVAEGSVFLADLVARDDWLPDEYAVADPARYRQYLMHCDPDELFSVVSFVWAPGQATPVHDHCTWGLVGQLRGVETSQRYEVLDRAAQGKLLTSVGGPTVARPGDVDAVSPRLGDIHAVSNVSSEVAISIHTYGGNIGRISRHTYAADGSTSPFVSGYVPTPYARTWS